jgi:hypothetical protein
VRSAAALEKMRAPPDPWTSLNRTREIPLGETLHSPEPIVKIANPRL